MWWYTERVLLLTCGGVVADRGMAHSEESRLANLLRRISREDDRDRRLATLKQLKEFISHGESKVVSQTAQRLSSCRLPANPLHYRNKTLWILLKLFFFFTMALHFRYFKCSGVSVKHTVTDQLPQTACPKACTTKQVQHTQGMFSLSGYSKPLVINSVSQPRVSQSSHEHVHIKGAVFGVYDHSQTWTSLLAAKHHILQTNREL